MVDSEWSAGNAAAILTARWGQWQVNAAYQPAIHTSHSPFAIRICPRALTRIHVIFRDGFMALFSVAGTIDEAARLSGIKKASTKTDGSLMILLDWWAVLDSNQ